jgi:hypothetical protein
LRAARLRSILRNLVTIFLQPGRNMINDSQSFIRP